MFVLQVGIGKYLDAPTWTDLRGSINDVMEMRKLLDGERFQVPPANIVTLTNEQATKQKIFAAYQENLIGKAKAYFDKTKKRDAVVLFQFSGHGSQAPDVDGDETDKLDETLVTYDSQDIKGKNFDITDDEIFALTSELKRYTDNIVYIFDSCHSGSGTRTAEDARRLPPRTTVPEPVAMPGIATRSGKIADDGANGTMMPPGDDYIVISAAQADQIATQKYCFEECGSAKEPVVYGLLTYYLIDELRNARSDTSYRDLMESVSRRVEAERPSQVPLVEGDERRIVFGSLAPAEDNFISVVSSDASGVKIRAGAIQGVTVGSIVSFYDRSTKRAENSGALVTGRVIGVTATESTVKLGSATRSVTTAEKAIVNSADIGTNRSKVLLDGIDANVATAVRESFATKNGVPDGRGVDFVQNTAVNRQTGRWDIALLKDKFSKVFPSSSPKCFETGGSENQSDPGRQIYYLVGHDFVPLFGFCVEAATTDASSVGSAARQIERALTHVSRYRSVAAIQNRRSRLTGKIVVKPIRLSTTTGAFSGEKNCVDGKFVADKYEAITKDQNGRYQFKPGEVFWFEVTNNSPFDLYVSMLNLRSDGSIKVQFPRNIDEEKTGVVISKNGGKRIISSDRCRLNASGEFIEAGAFRTSATGGPDAFKFLFTTSSVKWSDLSYLEMDSLTRNENASLATSNEWIALDLVFEVGETGKL